MAKNKSSQDIYIDIIASIARSAVSQIEGVSVVSDLRSSKPSNNDFLVYISEDGLVTIDIFVSVALGYKVPDVACLLQEKIKREVETTTKYKVATINVQVTGINFS